MSEVLTLEYDLAELPSSQHRAGLAGLVLMTRWLNEDEEDKKGICEITQVDETTATLKIDQEGLRFLFDNVYAAFYKTIESDKKPLGEKTEFKIAERDFVDEKTGRNKKQKVYVYDIIQPKGAFLNEYDKSDESIWIVLWRKMMWSILRGIDPTRRPFKERANGEFTEDADKVWQELNRPSDYAVELPSTYFIGAQASNAENVPFKDRARFQFLLHFWAFVAQIYVPITWEYERKTKREKMKDLGYALVIPDIADLKTFCEIYPAVLHGRSEQKFGYGRPKESIIDVAAEGALDLLNKINQKISPKVDMNLQDLLLGVDVVHLEKQGNNIRLWATSRVDPTIDIINKYSTIKEKYKNALFRRQRLLNLLNEKPWLNGFNFLLSKTESEQTINNSFFRNDARTAFEEAGVKIKSNGGNQMNEQTKELKPKTIEEIVYRLVKNYIKEKLRVKHDKTWKDEWKVNKNFKEIDEYNKLKGKIARDSFLAVRSRVGDDFTEYFASTICSYHQFSLKGDGFDLVARALRDENEQVRTLTMLALSANGYSPRENKEKTQ